MAAESDGDGPRIDIPIGREGGFLRITLRDDDTVRISRPGAWQQDLRRREAGALAEALDAIATTSGPGNPDPSGTGTRGA